MFFKPSSGVMFRYRRNISDFIPVEIYTFQSGQFGKRRYIFNPVVYA